MEEWCGKKENGDGDDEESVGRMEVCGGKVVFCQISVYVVGECCAYYEKREQKTR